MVSKAKGLSLNDAPKVDVDKMTSEVCVCTDVVDYQQEVILASGVDTANHVKNPQVWFEHGEDPLFTLTLAMAEDEDGNYTLTKPDDFTVYSVSHFAGPASQFPIVYQLFGLIDMGVIRATSIHVQPNPGGVASYSDPDTGRRYKVTEDSHLIEYSHCKVGVNPEALKKSLRFDSRLEPFVPESLKRAVELQANHASDVIRKGRIGDHELLPSVKKSLNAMVRTGSSMTLKPGDSQDSTMSEKPKLKSISGKDLVALSNEDLKAIAEDQEVLASYNPASQARIKSMFSKVMEDMGSEETPEEGESKGEDAEAPGDQEKSESVHHSDVVEEEEETVEESAEEVIMEDEPVAEEDLITKSASGEAKLGQSVLTGVYDALGYLNGAIEKAMGPVENPDVVAGMGEIMPQLKGMLEAIDGVHAKAYGSTFSTEGEGAEVVEQEDEEEALKGQLKSFLSRKDKQVENYRVIAHAGRLREFGQREDVPENVRKSLLNLSTSLESIQEAAKSGCPDTVARSEHDSAIAERDEMIASQKKSLAAQEAAITQLSERIDKLAGEALPAS
jgi:hypothetical protein